MSSRHISGLLPTPRSLRNPEACAAQFAPRADANCAAAGVTEEANVEQVRQRIRDKTVCATGWAATPIAVGAANLSTSRSTLCNQWCQIAMAGCTLLPAAFDVSEPLFLFSDLDPEIFTDVFSWAIVIALLSTGLCFEIYTRRYLVSIGTLRDETYANLYTNTKADEMGRENERQLNIKLQVAKCAFPILMLVALLALYHHEAYGVLVFNAALWKFGFPEVTVQATIGALQLRHGSEKGHGKLLIYACFNLGMFVGILMHHTAATIAYVFVLTDAVHINQQNVAIFLLVILQHLTTCISSVAKGVDSTPVQIFYHVCNAGCFVTEGLLQIELIAYAPVAESPVNVATILFSASHFIMMLIVIVFFLTHKGRVSTYFVPPPTVSKADPPSEQGQGPQPRRRRATSTLMSLEKKELSSSVRSNSSSNRLPKPTSV